MSQDAKWLRDSVLEFCVRHYPFDVMQEYDPYVFERAVLYANPKKIFEAIQRRTSASYYRHKDEPGKITPEWQKGSIKGKRHNKIDWLSVARMDLEWWINGIQFPRTGQILPQNIDKIRPQFMEIYVLVTNWVFIDFSHRALLMLFFMANKYSLDLIKQCMDKIEDKSKRSIEILDQVLKREFAILREEFLEREELTDHSKQIINTITEVVEKRDPVNWDNITAGVNIDRENQKEFDKVKLS